MKKLLFLPLLWVCQLLLAQEPTLPTEVVDEPKTSQTERIRSFHSDIYVDTAGFVKVTETIKVYAMGYQIRRGIFRSLPFYRKDKYGKKRRIDVEVLSVRKNNEEEPFHTEKKDENFVIYVGSKDVTLNEGEYTYEITYQSRGHVGFFDGFDELYWNVTGNEWVFPIDSTSATMYLPAGAHIKNTACYTGVTGSTARDCNMVPDSAGHPMFTAGGLDASEGLTVAVSWQSGLIQRPPPPGFFELLWDYKSLAFALLGLCYVFWYLYTTWKKYGKDAEKVTVIPSFQPPGNRSPSMLRYLYKRKMDARVFAVAIINLAVQKQLRIIQVKGTKQAFTLEDTETDLKGLSEEEKAVHNQLFTKKGKLEVTNKKYKVFKDAQSQLNKEITNAVNLKDYYNSNRKLLWGATWRCFLVLLIYTLLERAEMSIILTVSLMFWTISFGLFLFGIKCIRTRAMGEGIFLIIFSLPFLFGTSAMLAASLSSFSTPALIFTLLLGAAYVLYILLIPAYTQAGREMSAAIDGFRLYLSTAEEHRLNMLTPPELTPALFERLLPYAIALDLENEWGNKFSNVLEAANYQPGWYEGDPFAYGALAHALPERLGRSLDSAQKSPYTSSSSGRSSGSSSGSSGSSSWSSGSSGSGSSGGGGGGGGGGGW